MAEIGESIIFPKPRDAQETDLYNTLREFVTQVTKILNRGIIFSDNADCKFVTYTANAMINTQDTIAHGLGRIPTGFLVYDRDRDTNDPYRSAAYDATNLYLKCSTASAVFKIIVF